MRGDRKTLLGYALGTLPEDARAALEARLAEEPALCAALAEVREELALLDGLAEVEAPPGKLAERTIARLEQASAPPAETRRQRGPSWARAAAFAAAAAVALVFGVAVMQQQREQARIAAARHGLTMAATALKSYAHGARGERYPLPVQIDGRWTLDLRGVYPRHLPDPAVLLDGGASAERAALAAALDASPPDWDAAHRVLARNVVYTGYLTPEATDLERIQAPVRQLGTIEDRDLRSVEPVVYRLREGIERFLITDINNPAASASAQSTVPLLFRVDARGRDGRPTAVWVLYMDGHAERIERATSPEWFAALNGMLDAAE